MRRFRCELLLGAAALCLPATGVAARDLAELTVVVKNIENASGNIRLALWDKAEGFTEPEAASVRLIQPAVAGEISVEFDDLKPGNYALAAYHDENGNGKLDKNWLGFPDEGLAFSNGAWIDLGPPSFAKAAFEVRPGRQVVTVSLRY